MESRIFTIDRIINMPNSDWVLKELTPDGYVNVMKYRGKTKKAVMEAILKDGFKKIGSKNLYKC